MRVLGIDYGRRRIGLALSDASGLLARPWKTLAHAGNIADAAEGLAAEVRQLEAGGERVHTIVLGYPRRLSGEANQQTVDVEKLHAALTKLLTVPIVLQDERLSSYEAGQLMATRIKDWRKRKPLLDSAAAAIILQDFLDHHDRGSPLRGEDDET